MSELATAAVLVCTVGLDDEIQRAPDSAERSVVDFGETVGSGDSYLADLRVLKNFQKPHRSD